MTSEFTPLNNALANFLNDLLSRDDMPAGAEKSIKDFLAQFTRPGEYEIKDSTQILRFMYVLFESYPDLQTPEKEYQAKQFLIGIDAWPSEPNLKL